MSVEGALRPMKFLSRCLPLLVVPICVAVLMAACGGGSSKPSATATPKVPGPLDALADWVRANRNVDFIGDCSTAKPGVDVGKMCSALVGTRGTRSAYSIGPTFSDGTATAILEQGATGWTVLSVTNLDPSVAAVPGINWPLQVGDAVLVIGLGDTDCLNVRDQPTQQGKQIACESDGTKAIIQEGPVVAETFTWWRIAGDGFNGWAAGTWLRLPEAIAQALATPVPPTPASTP
jgi:hypothetical protein